MLNSTKLIINTKFRKILSETLLNIVFKGVLIPFRRNESLLYNVLAL